MRQFYCEDKKRHRAFMGIGAHDDLNCPPFDYYVYTHAMARESMYTQIFKHSEHPEWADEALIKRLALKHSEDFFEDMLHKTFPDFRLQQILAHTEWSKKQQKMLWQEFELRTRDLLWFNWLAQKAGYLLDIRVVETYPKVFDAKQMPIIFRKTEDGNIDKIGETDMSEGEMRALLQQRKVQNVRIYHKGEVWHCFYGTMKGLNGQEQGAVGSHPHYHYISDKWGIKLEDLLQRIQANDMPSSIHILFKKDLVSL